MMSGYTIRYEGADFGGMLARESGIGRMEIAGNTSDLASRMANVRRARKANSRGDRQYGRSSVTNGANLLRDVDGRSPLYRRYRDIANAILADQAGVEQCSEARKQLIRRFAAAAVLAEQLEARLARGEDIDINEHATLSSTQVRLAARIGIDRVPKDVTPSLSEYLARYAAARPEDEAEDNLASETGDEAKRTTDRHNGNGGLSGPEGHPSEGIADAEDEDA
jgi:hypothetical protein